MTIKPLGDRLVIQTPEKQEAKTNGGIILPGNANEAPSEAVVIAAGPGLTTAEGVLIPMTVKVGDKVLFSKYAVQELKVNGEDVKLLTERDVFAILED